MTRSEASRRGISRSAWYRAIDGGRLHPVHANVARVVGYPVSREQSILAAVLALEERPDPPPVVLASHRSAAFLLGMDRPASDPIEVTITGRKERQLKGVVVRRTMHQEDLTPTRRRRVPCTNELRTLVDLGAVEPQAVSAALDHFSVTRRLTPIAVGRLLERHGRSGRNGVTVLRHALAAWPLGDDIPDSQLEVAMARLLERFDLPPARFHAVVAGYEVDFLIEGTPGVVECDGWTHDVARRDQWELDLTRDAILHAAGYVVLRRSRMQVVLEQEHTADLISSLVDRPERPAS